MPAFFSTSSKKKGDGFYGQKSWSFEVVVDTELVSIRGDFSFCSPYPLANCKIIIYGSSAL
jgi:hypothetical protein